MDRNPFIHFFWFRQILIDRFVESQTDIFQELTNEEVVNRYMIWGIQNQFLHTFGNPDPVAGIILRPVNAKQLEKIKTDYWNSFTEFDRESDTLWIDFMHAPGNYPFMVDFVSQLGYKNLAWHNGQRDKFRIYPIANLKCLTPLANESWSEITLIPIQL